MGKISKDEKKTIGRKLREFKRDGLISYAKYLADQLEQSEGKEIRKAYTKYIKEQIKSTAKKIAKLEAKLTPKD
ncbi:MAG: hypothetical protein KBF73_02315 [Flavobacteriales bacterium]|nr:hypothetical protein [Flavobacteriales bacterium]